MIKMYEKDFFSYKNPLRILSEDLNNLNKKLGKLNFKQSIKTQNDIL